MDKLKFFHRLFSDGFYGIVDNDIVYFEHRDFDFDEEEELIVCYHMFSDNVWCAFPLRKYGETWAFTRKELVKYD